MIYNHPIGGLGNILFQIASIWALAKDNNDELCLVNIDKAIEILVNYDGNSIKHADKYKYIFDRLPNTNNIIKNGVHCSSYKFSPLQYRNEHQYYGFFQSEKYFKHRKKEILELFKPSEEFIDQINKYELIFGNIGMHVRRGNYIGHPVFDILESEYYEKALSLLPNELKVVIFSNDLEWCRKNFIGERFIFVDEVDYISIYIISKMKYNIIPNSTFSWWGAWMSEYEKVVAPKVWFGNNFGDNSDIVPEDWIKI